ncbi:MAG TPA: NADH-quinone oxidoreductase subunit J [Bacteroidales bacterium]|nr:NADH-quinone oxidoreductase subunit J [Bacteroidales bacterium]
MVTRYLFFIFSVIAVFAAVMVLVSKKPIHSVLYLTLTFLAIAGHFILLNAQFIAIVNVIVYAGAIMVLFLFTVMLLNLNVRSEVKKPLAVNITAVIAGGMLFLTLTGALRGVEKMHGYDIPVTQMGLVKNLGQVLFSDFRLPFEVSSVLFLAAMVGAVMLGKKTGD